ncbi:MAG TPA: prepilin peptidase [Candidatus Eisenbacteria bacterium]|jgi:leader peptidase (prepilin peptidase)/N-methyltransferase|nr:prepilin peptidase [Candidatus Eisenbacteria bacterium]
MGFLTALVFGLVVGSFLNVCIFRLPENESIVFPASHCRTCRKPIAWFDNVPVLSYALLGGKCRRCKAAISPQYAFVEALTGALFVLFYWKFGPTAKGAALLAFVLALVVESGIDFRHQIIPEEITLPGIHLGIVCSALVPSIQGQPDWRAGLLHSAFAMAFGWLLLYDIAVVGEKVFKREAMGGGDVMLMAMIGAFTGWQGVLWTLFGASLLGSIVGLYLRFRKGGQEIPFGPFLGMAAAAYLFVGREWIAAYFNFLASAGS